MPQSEAERLLLSSLMQKADVCNNRIYLMAWWFLGVSALSYFLGLQTTATLSAFGANVAIPQKFLVATTPAVLALLFYLMSCFINLESAYYSEIGRALASGTLGGDKLSAIQIKMLESPSWITYHELRDLAGTHRLILAAGEISTYGLVVAMTFLPLGAEGYFVWRVYRMFGWSLTTGMQTPVILLTVFALVQLFESIKLEKRKPK